MADGSPNPYIRTYAKDMATLSKKGDGSPSTEPEATVGVASVPVPSVSETLSPAAERDAVLTRLRERAVKDPITEGELLPPMLPTPQPKAASIGSATFARPVPLPPSPISNVPRVTVIAPPPRPAAPIPNVVVPPPPPVPAPTPPPPLPPPVPAPITAFPQLTPKDTGPSPIHTYTSDFADRIDTKKASAFTVLAAQADASSAVPKTKKESPITRKGILITVAGLLLIVAGGAGIYAAYRYAASRAPVSITPTVPSLVFADDRQALTGEGAELLQGIAASADTTLPEGQVRVLYLAQASTTASGKNIMVPLAGGKLFGALQLSSPDIFLRNIAPESTIGVVHAGIQTRAFFILKVLSYERTFAGMLQWEGRMQSELALLYPLYAPVQQPPTIATTTRIVNGKKVVATTTIEATVLAAGPLRFVDEVASNHDVRALKDDQGHTVLLYGYKDKEILIIARDEAAFAELINRLAATKQQ